MRISTLNDNIKAYVEYACMVCMADKRMTDARYKGCAMRKIGEVCPWQEEVLHKIMGDDNNHKGDIFSNWAEIPIVKETFKKSADNGLTMQEPRYINLEGLK